MLIVRKVLNWPKVPVMMICMRLKSRLISERRPLQSRVECSQGEIMNQKKLFLLPVSCTIAVGAVPPQRCRAAVPGAL
jgi:hypothetical protein